MNSIRKIAAARTKVHDGVRRADDTQVLSERDLIGLIAEHRFAETYALTMDMRITPNGDDGFDFVSRKGNTVDIKATTRPKGRLMVRTTHITADIYVLAIVDVAAETARFVGWCTAQQVRQLGQVEHHHGKPFYCVRQDRLLSLESRTQTP